MLLMPERLKERLISILRWSERYTRTDMVYLASGGVWLSLGQFISMISVLLLGLAFANLIPKDTYGIYKYVLSIAGILSIFALPGMTTSLMRAVARGFDGSLAPATRARATWGALGMFPAIILAAYYFFNGNSVLAWSCVIVAFFLPIFDTFNTYTSYLQGKKRFAAYVSAGAIVQTVSIAVLIGTMFVTSNLYALLIAYFGSYALLRFASWLYVRMRYPTRGSVDPEVIKYGKHLSVMNVLGQMAAQADTLLLFHFLGPVEVARYSIAIAAPEQLKSLINTVNNLLFPRFANYSREEIQKTIVRKSALLTIVVAGIVLAYALAAPFLFHTFFPKYIDAVLYSQLFAFSLLNVFSLPAVVYLQSHGRIREQYYFNTVVPIMQVVLMTIGIAFAGLLGLVLARMLTRIGSGGMAVYLFYHPVSD